MANPNDEKLVEDINGDLSPAYFNRTTEKYEYLEGEDGANFVKIVDQNGNPLSVIPTQDSDVKTELEAIKLRQEAIDNKLDSIIENGAVNTQLTGSNTEYVFLEYVELTAGSTVYTEAQDYNGSRLGVNVRFNNAIKHWVRGFFQSKQTGRGVGGSVNIIDSRNTATAQARGSLQMTTTRVNIGITNDDVIDTQINLVSIVDFII